MANYTANKQLNGHEAHTHIMGALKSALRKESSPISKINELCGKTSEIAKEVLLAMAVSGIMITPTYAGQNPGLKEKPAPDYHKNANLSKTLAMVVTKPQKSEYLSETSNASIKGTDVTRIYKLQTLIPPKNYWYLNPQSTSKPSAIDEVKFSILRSDNPPNYYDVPGFRYEGLNDSSTNLFPLPMNVQDATVAYFTYVIKHKGFRLYSENSHSGQLAITLSKGNHGALGFYFSLTF
ncbi:MAG: hypothetical protein M1520_01380 [Candidatus Marsarchaeota archaeon]|nr:hypothetical protein [Candidatus Marsarchaeota archaeon]